MSRRIAFSCALLFVMQSIASAQVIFEPVRYQYGNDYKFYYGGSDPRVIERALDYEYRAGRRVSPEAAPFRIYCDSYPNHNAALYGATIADARDEAYHNVPRYFRTRDLLNAAIPQADGTLIVPAHAQPVVIVPARARTLTPATEPRRILIIPKDLLDRKLMPQGEQVAAAR